MRLMVAHKILMVAFLMLCAILLVRGIRLYASQRSTSDLALGISAGIVGVGLGFYVQRIWRR
jgi:hypothetical protein